MGSMGRRELAGGARALWGEASRRHEGGGKAFTLGYNFTLYSSSTAGLKEGVFPYVFTEVIFLFSASIWTL